LYLRYSGFALLLFCLLAFGCQTPPVPPEVQKAEQQEYDLWRAGAPVYSLEDYSNYKQDLQRAKERLGKEKLKLGFFRDYRPIKADFDQVLERGGKILLKVHEIKDLKSDSIVAQVAELQSKLKTLEEVTLVINEKGLARKKLAEAQVMLKEVSLLTEHEKFDQVPAKVNRVEALADQAREAVLAMLVRYRDPAQIVKWRKWADETVAETRRSGSLAIVVNKLEHKLIIYKKGSAISTYDVGLGSNGLSDKLYAGDDATPEGKYQVVLKIPASKYYKALLINYPNDEDRRQFVRAKQRGELLPSAGIGGSIEIHGGGKDSLTAGCVSMENEDMDKVYELIKLGTPVTIVGAQDVENSVIRAIKNL